MYIWQDNTTCILCCWALTRLQMLYVLKITRLTILIMRIFPSYLKICFAVLTIHSFFSETASYSTAVMIFTETRYSCVLGSEKILTEVQGFPLCNHVTFVTQFRKILTQLQWSVTLETLLLATEGFVTLIILVSMFWKIHGSVTLVVLLQKR